MKVELWSDVVCPFCYTGKQKFEKPLAKLIFNLLVHSPTTLSVTVRLSEVEV